MTNLDKLPQDYEVKKQYQFSCAACGHWQTAKPSIMMRDFRINSGHGSCMECRTFLHLMIDTDDTDDADDAEQNIILSQDWDDWLAETVIMEKKS